METDWIHNEILDGLSKLICLSLDRTPAADMVMGTAAVWVEAISDGRVWDEALDKPRFRKAFVKLSQVCRKWPGPVEFIEAMPPRAQLVLTKQPITAAPDSPAMRERFDQIAKLFEIPKGRKAETGHGHVIPRKDGKRARCGGPGVCPECSREAAMVNAEEKSA